MSRKPKVAASRALSQIVVCGLTHISQKIGRHYKMLSERTGASVTILSADVTGVSARIAEQYGLEAVLLDSHHVKSLRKYCAILRSQPTMHVELYQNFGSDLLQLCFVLLTVLTRTPLVTWCRGGELLWWHKASLRRRCVIWISLFLARLVPYKQLHMPEQLDQLRISRSKRLFFYNRILISADEPARVERRKGVLFANSWKAFRHPDVALDVALRLAPRFPDTRFIIAGHRDWLQEAFSKEEFEARVAKCGLSDQVRILPFVERPEELMRECSIFLLPAEIVFLNYAWLEAMERALVCVVANRQGAERVVTHGEDGLLVDLDSDSFADAVESLLADGTNLQRMADRARARIVGSFDLEKAIPELIAAYRSRVWRSNRMAKTFPLASYD